MAWKAYLESANDPPVPNDTLDAVVRYQDDSVPPRVITRAYNLTAGQFPTLADFRDFIAAERQKLNRFDSVKNTIKSLIGAEIT